MKDGRRASIDKTQFSIRGSPRSLLDFSENETFDDFNTGWLIRQQISILAQAVPGGFPAGCHDFHPAVHSWKTQRQVGDGLLTACCPGIPK
jgi:hypothetical protein